MKDTDTRPKALEAALELFSRKGYPATSMGDIAGALGIKAPSLYKHFKGKEELYAALFPALEEHYQALWREAGERQVRLEREVQGVLAVQQLEEETLGWFHAELDDPRAACFRRLLALGQFDDPDPLERWLWAEPLALYESFFSRLVGREVLRRGDPHVMAVEYLAPIFRLLAQGDRLPDRRSACLEEAGQHIRQFHRIFAHREPRAAAQGGVGRLFRR